MRSLVYYHPLISAIVSASLFRTTPATAFSSANLSSPPHFNNMASPSSLYSWRPGTELLHLDPSTLCKEGDDRPQLAKDEDYASAIVKAWKNEVDKRLDSDGGSVSSPFVYKCKSDGSCIHGHIYRLSSPADADDSTETNSLPGIVLFHTGAGPQDIYLRWKADSLVNEHDVFGNKGCVVLIADILGDQSGWAWHDRARYGNVRKSVLVPDENGERKKLVGRVQAAIDAIKAEPGVDPERIGAMGFCLGGHPIMELARLKDPSVKAMVTFHGVFDGVRKLSSIGRSMDGAKCNVLVCTGEDDPFVPSEDLDAAMNMFNDLGYQNNMMKFEHTRHGFTNPAQDYNPSDAFAYSEEAYTKAWSAALSLLKNSISH